jgi:hypothetical protein
MEHEIEVEISEEEVQFVRLSNELQELAKKLNYNMMIVTTENVEDSGSRFYSTIKDNSLDELKRLVDYATWNYELRIKEEERFKKTMDVIGEETWKKISDRIKAAKAISWEAMEAEIVALRKEYGDVLKKIKNS